MDQVVEAKQTGWRGSAELWLDAAYDALVTGGIEAVRVKTLAGSLGLSRTSFYHHFDSREALLAALIDRWERKNTGNLIARTEGFAATITEAVFNLFDCWIDPALFDARLDFAIRNWALADPALKPVIDTADRSRIRAITAMFARFDYAPAQAETRAMTLYYTQVGYISMRIEETLETRATRMPAYIETFTGRACGEADIARFRARHAL
ncbi:MAG: TetR/AcrR family transcriptional regulator [Rhodobacteraceae bacterium]|nr:TetR/AcrR family transcriptional regulator [Paracoccaceae bacterium]